MNTLGGTNKDPGNPGPAGSLDPVARYARNAQGYRAMDLKMAQSFCLTERCASLLNP